MSGAELQALIERLGFVQVDSINTVERAHHMILFARNQTYRPRHLERLLGPGGSLFENWTHDAAIIPSRFYPYWQARFEAERERLKTRWAARGGALFERTLEEVQTHVRERGATLSRHFEKEKPKGGAGWWDWHPTKTALEYLWRTGELAVAGRDGFQKVYDLSQRVIPESHRAQRPSRAEMVDWACDAALERLGMATSGEIAAFWDLVSPAEAKAWCAARLGESLIEVTVENADGGKPRQALARPDLAARLAEVPDPPKRLRVVSPFDPVLRDRKRARRLFDFDYRIEVFVPAAKRRYGYYVFPLLEGDRFIGRIDMKCDRPADTLSVKGLWLEPGLRFSKGRAQRLEAELERLARFAGVGSVVFEEGFRKEG